MTDQQQKFIWRAYAEKASFSLIAQELNLPVSQLTVWNKELEEDWRILSRMTALYKTKIEQYSTTEPGISLKEFYHWFLRMEENKRCHYCNITEEELSLLWKNNLIDTKRKRGRKLELDRLLPNMPYSELSNIVYACYWCNNAKTDTFTDIEFQQVGKVIANIWGARLEKI